MVQQCEFCGQDGGEILYRGDSYRVVLIDDPLYPGFCRVIWNAHAREMTDLADADRVALMAAVWKVEEAVREVMAPYKVNVASLGNQVPHLHWHVIPRYEDDAHYPNPVWGGKMREPEAARLEARRALLPGLRVALRARFAGEAQ